MKRGDEIDNEITLEYAKLAFKDDWQSDAMLLVDQAWRRRNNFHLVRSLPVAGCLEPLVVEYAELKKLKFDYLSSGLIDAVSADLVEFLRTKIHAEFLPIQGMHRGRPYHDRQFYIVHFLDRCAAMDLGRSVFAEYLPHEGGGINRVEKLVLDGSRIFGSPAFVLDELALVCFRNDICQSILDAGFEGLRFIPLAEYQNVRL
ncbi:MAG: hypothetical protein REI94_06465 [Moraxellaceae bacterium]|nr:hypothetical protein [Moraxellaceae bacterium]